MYPNGKSEILLMWKTRELLKLKLTLSKSNPDHSPHHPLTPFFRNTMEKLSLPLTGLSDHGEQGRGGNQGTESKLRIHARG